MTSLVALVGLATALMLAPQASAATAYEHVGEFGGTGTDPGLFAANPMPQRLAVQEGTGNVFVADTGNDRIQVFEPDGDSAAFLLAFGSAAVIDNPVGIAVDQDTGDVYVTASGTTNAMVKFKPDDPDNPTDYTLDPTFTSPPQGSGPGEIGSFGSGLPAAPNAGGVAVDPTSGEILVADPGNNLIQRYDSGGYDGGAGFLGSFDGSTSGDAFGGVLDLAVDSGGNVIVADLLAGAARIERFDGTGSHLATLGPVPNGAVGSTGVVVGVNPVTDEVFVSSKSPTVVSPGRIFQFEGDDLVFDFGVPGDRLTGFMFGIALRGADPGRLYVLATQSFLGGVPRVQVFDDVGELADPPTVAIDPPSGVTGTDATFTGTVNPEGAQTGWRFEYRRVGASEWIAVPEPDGDAGAGSQDVTVEATVAGLEPNTDYEVRLIATNSGGTTESNIVAFKTAATPPVVVSADAIAGATAATLRGRVNPRNSASTYWFEYGLDQTYGQFAPAPPPGEDAGGGGQPEPVFARIRGLEPGTIYHFRLVAESAGGRTEGPDRTFETGAPLPDRAFEVASPVPTGGVNTRTHNYVSAENGDRVMFETVQSLPGAETFSRFYISERGADGWSTQSVDPGPEGPTWWLGGPVTPTADLSRLLINTPGSFDPDDQNGDPDDQSSSNPSGRDLYVREQSGELTWISRDPRQPIGTPQIDPANALGAGNPSTSAITTDGSTVAFHSLRQLVDEDTTSDTRASLYRWSDGELSFLGERPDGSVASGGSQLGDGRFTRNAVSRDGSRVVVKTPKVGGGPAARTLYVHEDGEPIVEPIPDLGGVHPRDVAYAGADQDVSRIYFTSASRLTPDSGASHSSNAHSDLYAFDVESETLRDLTPRMDGVEDPEVDPDVEDRARVLGVVASSDDGRRVYFVADGQLPAEPSPLGEEPSPEGRNLYLAELDGIDDEVRMHFVASLGPPTSDGDQPIWGGPAIGADDRQAHTAPNGTVLVFGSVKSVTGHSTAGQRQAYVYDNGAGTLACASCPGDGPVPAGEVDLSSSSRGGSGGAIARHVSADGTVFFHTPTPLVPADINDVDDVYEYSHGELRLVSAGTGSSASRFADASVDGSTVFFRTRDALAPQDGEPGVAKVYAARVGGGFPGPPPPPPPCFGDGCQGQSPPTPSGDDPGSAGAVGPASLADSRFSFTGARKNRRRGKARLTVKVPGPGELELARNRKVKPASKSAPSEGRVRLQVRPARKAKRRLRRKLHRKMHRQGKARGAARIRVRARVTFAPERGEPRTKTKRLNLVKRKAGQPNRSRKTRKR